MDDSEPAENDEGETVKTSSQVELPVEQPAEPDETPTEPVSEDLPEPANEDLTEPANEDLTEPATQEQPPEVLSDSAPADNVPEDLPVADDDGVSTGFDENLLMEGVQEETGVPFDEDAFPIQKSEVKVKMVVIQAPADKKESKKGQPTISELEGEFPSVSKVKTDEEEEGLLLVDASEIVMDKNVEDMVKAYEGKQDRDDSLIVGEHAVEAERDIDVTSGFTVDSEALNAFLDDDEVKDELPGRQVSTPSLGGSTMFDEKSETLHQFEVTIPQEAESTKPIEEKKTKDIESKSLIYDDAESYSDESDDDPKATELKSLLTRRRSGGLSDVQSSKPRIPVSDVLNQIEGDFRVIDPDLIFQPDTEVKLFEAYHTDEEEEEKVMEEKDDLPVTLDRQPYLDRHNSLLESLRQETIKNLAMQKKLIELLKKKKMDQFLREGDVEENLEFIKRYKMQLAAYEAQEEYQNTALGELNKDLEIFKNQRDMAVRTKEELFQKLQDREKEIGTGLIHSKTGKTLPDKTVENLIVRQGKHQEQICSMRLKYVKLKNKIIDIQAKLQQLELIDGHLSLMDYETLKIKFRGYVEKLEERDDELNKLRVLCQNSIQILAHYKEKSNATDVDLDYLAKKLEAVEIEVNICRENLNTLKQERDHYRIMTYNLREEAGLLTKPDLLFDMEDSIEELKVVTEKLAAMEHENAIKKIQVRNIRKNIEIQSEIKKEAVAAPKGLKLKHKLPPLKKTNVILPSEAFEDLHRLPKPNPCAKFKKRKY